MQPNPAMIQQMPGPPPPQIQQSNRIPPNQPPTSMPTSIPNDVMTTNVNTVPIENQIKVSQQTQQPPPIIHQSAQSNRQKRPAILQDPETLQEKDLNKLAELPITQANEQATNLTAAATQQAPQQSQLITENHDPNLNTSNKIAQAVNEEQPIKQEVVLQKYYLINNAYILIFFLFFF